MKKEAIFATKVVRESLTYSDEQIEKRADEIFKFLAVVHPTLTTDEKGKGCVEIRFLLRGDGLTSPQWSFNTWSLTDKDKQELIKKLKEFNGLSVCTYYSLYTYNFHMLFDKNKKPVLKGGKKPAKIRNLSAMYCESLGIDFDNITEEQFLKEKQRLLNLGIETLDIFSGHGYQSLILLNEKNDDKELLKKLTNLLISKGFKNDENLKDCARVFRLNCSYNCKEFAKDDVKHYNPVDPKGIPTSIYSWTEKRYDVNWVFDQLNSLETVVEMKEKSSENDSNEDLKQEEKSTEDNFEFINNLREHFSSIVPASEQFAVPVDDAVSTPPVEESDKNVYTTNKNEKANTQIKDKTYYKKLYKHFDYMRLPNAVQNILMGTPDTGTGNDTLMFILPFMKNYLKLSLKQRIETMKEWGKLCNPAWEEAEIESEVRRLDKYNFEAMYGTYTKNMKDTYGKLEFVKWKNNDEIVIPNDVFEKIKHISDGAFRIYLATKLLEIEENRTNFTNEEIWKRSGIAERTFKKHIGCLTEENLLSKKVWDRSKKNSDKYLYYINPYTSSFKGFTKIKVSLIRLLLLEDLNDAQIAFYVYLKHMIGNSEGDCWASQRYIARELGKKSHTTISKLTDELHAKKMIRKETNEVGGVPHTTYLLLV